MFIVNESQMFIVLELSFGIYESLFISDLCSYISGFSKQSFQSGLVIVIFNL